MRSKEEIKEKIKWSENNIKLNKQNIEILKWVLENEERESEDKE